MVAQQYVSSAYLCVTCEWSVVDYDHDDVQQKKGAAVAEWLSSWLAEQEERGSIPRLATWIFRDWLSPASKSRYGWKIAKSTLIKKQPTNVQQKKWYNRINPVLKVHKHYIRAKHYHLLICIIL